MFTEEKTLRENHFRQSDRDLLIEVNTKLDRAILDIKDMKDNTSERIADLYAKKLDVAEANRLLAEGDKVHSALARRDEDFERRVRRLEYALALATGGFAILEIVLRFMK